MTTILSDRSKGETNFIDQYTRSLTVGWADQCVRGGAIREISDGTPYTAHARSKGWITKKEPLRLTAAGFQTAAAFLKR